MLARRAADRVNVRLAAPRRYGKTSVLLAHAQRLQATDWRTAHVDLSRVADLTDVARRLAAPDAAAAETVRCRLLDLRKELWERDRVPALVVLDEFQDLLVARAIWTACCARGSSTTAMRPRTCSPAPSRR